MALKILKALDAFFFQFEDIVESHARTVDITTHNYYDMLYAFHVFRGNFRKGKKTLKCLNTSRIDVFLKKYIIPGLSNHGCVSTVREQN